MIKVWVLSTCIPEECQPGLPRVFATETAALQAFREEMATEWQYNGIYGEDGELLPCPENPYEANEAMANAGPGDVWGAWELLPIEIEGSEEGVARVILHGPSGATVEIL